MHAITINNKVYECHRSETPHAKRCKGHGGTALAMERAGIAQEHVVRLPGGSRFYQVQQYRNGTYGRLVKVA